MDPQPSMMGAASDTRSETWSDASSTIVDTRSEPPRCYGKEADKIMKRASGKPVSKEPAPSPPVVLTTTSSKAGSSQASTVSSGRSSSKKSSKKSSSSSGKKTSPSSTAKNGLNASPAVSNASSSQRSGSSKSRDPESSRFAIVPHNSSGGAIDPPSCGGGGASTSGSSSSTECTGPTLYDPPTTDGTSFADGSATYQSTLKHNEQLAVWNEGEDECIATLGSDEHSASIASAAASSESSTCDSFDDDTSADRGSELASAVERALAIREDTRSEGTSTHDEIDGSKCEEEVADDSTDAKDARALVQSDYHGGVNSYYGPEGGGGDGALVTAEKDNRYLSTAVDNTHAIVPIDSTIYEAYDHTFVTCPENLRFRFLYTFLKKNLDKKVMIFFSTTNSAKFHARLLERFHVPVLTMHGNQKREKFIGRFFKFSDLDEGILCATDSAGRDLDIPPSVDWVIQFEPPDDPSEYILRVARISCDSDRVGRSLLFLNPGEQGFLKYYHSASIPVSEFEIPRALADVQSHIEHHVNDSDRLLRYARDAYGSYLLAYASHGFRDVYNVHDLSKLDVAAAFGLVGGLPSVADDQTTETDTLVSSYVNGIGGGELGGDATKRKSSGGKGKTKNNTWEKTEKTKSKSWMRGEKSWPHSQIKLHPKFKQSEVGHS